MQLWNEKESNYFNSSIQKDLLTQLNIFIEKRNLSFKEFKNIWKFLQMSDIHDLCPNKINLELFLQSIFQNALSLLNLPPNESILRYYPNELSQCIWNIGVFYLLYCLYGTRRDCCHMLRIRVGPEEWFELNLAYQRLKLLGRAGLQAIKTFHKLHSDSAFYFCMYSGGSSLYRISKILDDVISSIEDGEEKRRYDVNYFKELKEGNEYLSNHLEEMRNILINGINSSIPGFNIEDIPLSTEIENENNNVNNENNENNFLLMDESIQEFFGITPNSSDQIESNVIVESTESEDDSIKVSKIKKNDKKSEIKMNVIKYKKDNEMNKDIRNRETVTNRSNKVLLKVNNVNEDSLVDKDIGLSLLEQLEKDTMEVLDLKSQLKSTKSSTITTATTTTTTTTPTTITIVPKVTTTTTKSKGRKTHQNNDVRFGKKEKVERKKSDKIVRNSGLDILEQLEKDTLEVLGIESQELSKSTIIRSSIESDHEINHVPNTRSHQKRNIEKLTNQVKERKTRNTRKENKENTEISILEQLERDTMEVLGIESQMVTSTESNIELSQVVKRKKRVQKSNIEENEKKTVKKKRSNVLLSHKSDLNDDLNNVNCVNNVNEDSLVDKDIGLSLLEQLERDTMEVLDLK